MLILGIDPGSATTGFGLIEVGTTKTKSSGLCVIDYGCIVTPREWVMGDRLKKLHEELLILFKKYRPDMIAIEQIFFFSNAKTIIPVGQARGIVLLAAAESEITVKEYSPLQIKLEFTGYGRAKKPEVQKKLKEVVGITALKKDKTKKFSDGHHFDDAADALAVAICHFYKNGGEGFKTENTIPVSRATKKPKKVKKV